LDFLKVFSETLISLTKTRLVYSKIEKVFSETMKIEKVGLVSEKVSRDTFSVSEVTSGNLEGFRDSRI
jgi:hypothetical protein